MNRTQDEYDGYPALTPEELDALADKLIEQWTIEEKEEFFASQDAVTGLFSGSVANNASTLPDNPPVTMDSLKAICDKFHEAFPIPIEWSTGAWNGPLIELDPDDPFGYMEQLFSSGVHITSIVPPEQGWPIVAHCDICHKTEIVLSPYAAKPSDGDYWKLEGTCLDEEKHIKHNMYPQRWSPWREKDALPME